MSLINEALKKAQRSRTAGPDGTQAPLPGGRHIAKRGPARSANMMVLLGSGAIVLVVLSVVVTIYLLNRPSSTPAPVITAAKAPAAAANAPATATVTPSIPPAPPPRNAPTESAPPASPPNASAPGAIPASPPPPVASTSGPPPPSVASTPPLITPAPPQAQAAVVAAGTGTPTTEAAVKRAATPPVVTPAPRAPASSGVTPAPTAPATSSAAAAPKNLPPAPGPDERIAAFVESLRIAGVRSSGPDAKVLIGGRTFKVNDIIDRNLGVRLVNVAPGVLTFADSNGVTYAKNL